MKNQSAPSRWPWIMLFSRILLFFGVQAAFALGFWLAGTSGAMDMLFATMFLGVAD